MLEVIDKASEIASEIIKEENKPKSIRQIKNKYGLSFPFSVQKVVCFGLKQGVYALMPIGTILTIENFNKISLLGEGEKKEVATFEYNKRISFTDPDLEQYVWVGE